MIGGQALIEGIMMRGPDKDAVWWSGGKEGLTVEVTPGSCRRSILPCDGPPIRGSITSLAPTS